MSVVRKLKSKSLICPPGFLPTNLQYETIMGSHAYGVNNKDSDQDIYGFCIPPKDYVFPHTAGYLYGFGTKPPAFDQFQTKETIYDPDTGIEYDLAIYGIVRYFQLCLENNPNMLDSLFTPENCVTHCTAVGQMVRDNRKIFLHKGAWHKYRGYAMSQLHKMKSQKREGKRKELFDKWGFDIKFAYHLVRLLYEAQMILEEGDLDLLRHREHLKAIRRGDFKEEEIREWAEEKNKYLERLYEETSLPQKPREDEVKQLLLDCLEHHYGSLTEMVGEENQLKNALRKIATVVDEIQGALK